MYGNFRTDADWWDAVGKEEWKEQRMQMEDEARTYRAAHYKRDDHKQHMQNRDLWSSRSRCQLKRGTEYGYLTTSSQIGEYTIPSVVQRGATWSLINNGEPYTYEDFDALLDDGWVVV